MFNTSSFAFCIYFLNNRVSNQCLSLWTVKVLKQDVQELKIVLWIYLFSRWSSRVLYVCSKVIKKVCEIHVFNCYFIFALALSLLFTLPAKWGNNNAWGLLIKNKDLILTLFFSFIIGNCNLFVDVNTQHKALCVEKLYFVNNTHGRLANR